MAEKKYLDYAGLQDVAGNVNTRLKTVTTMPATASDGAVRLYAGETSASYTKGHIYQYQVDTWVDISATMDLTPYKKIFTGTRAEWDLLTTEEKKAYDEADLTDDPAGGELLVTDAVTLGDLNPVTSNAVAKAVNYSTAEVKTGATWIDGKPIYRKVIDVGAMPSNTVKSVAHGISNIGTVVSCRGQATSNGTHLGLPYLNTDSTSMCIQVYSNATDIVLRTGVSTWTGYSGFVVVEYTKTTD